jgi:hypothetical protein
MTLLSSGVGLTWCFSRHAGRSTSIQTALPRDTVAQQPEKDAGNQDAKKTDKMFPDGLDYDFGNVTRGTQCVHSFRVVNTSNIPLHILSLRTS